MTSEKQSYPKRLWSATPEQQTRILITNPDNPGVIVRTLRFREGSVVVDNEREEELVRYAMGKNVFDEDLATPEVNKHTAWVCYSSKAYKTYLEHKPPHNDPMKR